MIRRPPRSTQGVSSAASDVYKRQGRIIAATKSYPESENDKTIILRDKFIWRIQNEEPWKSYKYSLYNADGSATDYKGAWLVVDGGYPKVIA